MPVADSSCFVVGHREPVCFVRSAVGLHKRLTSLRTLVAFPRGSPMPSAAIRSLDLQARDIVDYCGCLHRVTHVGWHSGWAWPIAFDNAGWAIALGPDLVVVQRAVQTPHPPDRG